jgi:hypothetical protein
MKFSLGVMAMFCAGVCLAQEGVPMRDLTAYADGTSARAGDLLTLVAGTPGGVSPAVETWMGQNAQTHAALMVVGVLPNGNLVVEGRSKRGPDAETCELLTGVISARAIGVSRTVEASELKDAVWEQETYSLQASAETSALELNELCRPF